jgi:hypothetical protein
MGAGRRWPNPLVGVEPLAEGAAALVACVFDCGFGVRRPGAIAHAVQRARTARRAPGSGFVVAVAVALH